MKCAVPNCENPSTLTYLEHPICLRCFERHSEGRCLKCKLKIEHDADNCSKKWGKEEVE